MIDGRMRRGGHMFKPFHQEAASARLQRIVMKFLMQKIDSQKEIALEKRLK